jgi:hypothetical protein
MPVDSIDKGLYAAPQGIEAELGDMGGISDDDLDSMLEIEITNPDMVTLDDGSVEITLIAGDDAEEGEFDENLAETLDEGVQQTLASDLIELIDADINNRKDWADTFVKGLEVLGFRYEERTEPWEDACGAFSSVLAEAAIRFQAEAMSETFPSMGPVKTKVMGQVTREKEEAAGRVKEDMNYQLTERMVEYRPEHERMLYALGLAGSAFKKVYFDPALGRQVAIFIPAEDMLVPYGASNLESAERITHVMRKTENEIKRLQASGFYRDVDLGEPQSFPSDIEKKKAEEGGYSLTDDDRYTIYEVHADLVIEGVDEDEIEDGSDVGDDEDEDAKPKEVEQLAKPYVVTIERATEKVLSIRRNWEPEDPLHQKRQHFVHYVYVPGFGFYGLGLIHIIGGYSRAGTSLLRQLVDAGTLSNLPGGLKARGMRVKGDDTPIGPGEFRDVDIPSGAIKDNIMMLPYKEPSQVLLALMTQINEDGRRLGAISDMNISDMSAQAPVGTTLALLERTLKPMAAVQARVHYAMKQEFKLLKELIRDYTPEAYSYDPQDTTDRKIKQSDYDMVEVIPVSDPNSSTMAQRVVQYQAVLQMAQQAPQIYNLPQLHRQMIEVLGVKNADKLVPIEDDQKPTDPVSENMNVLIGKPVKAFIYQDHDAHIAAHTSFMQDPMIAQTMGQNPQAQQLMAALQAHIAEHLGFSYRKQIEERLGAPLPVPGEELPEEIEIQLARLVAEAGKQLAQEHQQQAAQQQAQQQAQDPMFQLQQGELKVKQAEVARKQAKDQADLQLQEQKLGLDRERLQVESQRNANQTSSQDRQSQQKMRLDVMKHVTQQPPRPGGPPQR